MLESSGSNCILIPIHNRKATTIQCLHRLDECELGSSYRVVVIDDGSKDGSKEIIKSLYPEVTVIQGDGTLWWTGAIKLGMEYAETLNCKNIIWLNDDCLIQLGTLEHLIGFIKDNRNSIIGGTGYKEASSTQFSFGGKQKRRCQYTMLTPANKGIHPCDLLSGNLVCMPIKVIQDIGYPNPEKCAHYGGDSHFLIRARKAGYSIFVDTRLPAQDITTTNTSIMNANRWLLGETSTKELFQLIFTPQSILSWKVWWFLYTEDYRLTGVVLFLIKFIKIIATLLCISALRPLPLTIRERISLMKRSLLERKG